MFSNERAVFYVDNPLQAVPLLQFLRANGIEADTLDADDMGGMNPALTFTHGSGIVVAQEDADRARELIADFVDAGEDDAGEDDAGEDDAGEDDAGEDEAGEDEAGEDEAGEDDAEEPDGQSPDEPMSAEPVQDGGVGDA